MEIFILENCSKKICTEKECTSTRTERFILGILWIINLMEMECTASLMGKGMKGILSMEWRNIKESTIIRMGTFIMEIGVKIKK